MVKLSVWAAAVAASASWVGSVRAAESPAKSDRVVVMISVDGLAGFYLDDAKAEMPNIRALAAAGARASGMEAVTPTVTWPNHTTLVTGDYPGRHGVTGNNYLDRTTGKPVALISDPVFDKDRIVKVPTIYDVAHAAGIATAAIRWPASRNARALDWTAPDCATTALELRYTTPALVQDCVAAGLMPAPSAADADADVDDGTGPKRFGDPMATAAFNLILKNHRPGLALLHVSNVDHTEHQFGPRTPEAYAAVKRADAEVGQVWDEVKRDYPGRGTIVIVSDHGFSPINRTVLPNVILRNAGLLDVHGNRATGGKVRVVVQGGAAMVYILDNADRDAIAKQVTRAFTNVAGVEKVVGPGETEAYGVADPKVDPHAPDMIVFADEGYAFGDTAAGVLTFNEKPERKGTHGHDPHLPDLHATFVAWGAGIKQGTTLGVVRNIDVAPTVASILGVSMGDTDGKPIAACLAAGPAAASADR